MIATETEQLAQIAAAAGAKRVVMAMYDALSKHTLYSYTDIQYITFGLIMFTVDALNIHMIINRSISC